MQGGWTIQMFGGLRLCGAGHTQARFRTQKTAALLARLAYPPLRSHAREELIGWLWPDAEEEDGRRSLRVALNSLRHQLEPPTVAAGSILQADRLHVRLDAGAIRTDVAEFGDALVAAARTSAGRTWPRRSPATRGRCCPASMTTGCWRSGSGTPRRT